MHKYSIEQKEVAVKLSYQNKKVLSTCKKIGYQLASILRL